MRLVALIGFVRTASLTSRAGEERKPLANAAAVSDGVQGKPDWHDGFMGFAHAARKAPVKSSHSIDLLAIVPAALSQDDRDTFAGVGFTVLPRPPFVPLKEVENAFGSSKLLKGCFGVAENLKLYASKLVDYDRVFVLDGDVMLLGAFDELVDLQNPLLGTSDYEVILPSSAFPPINGGPRYLSEPTLSGAAVSCCTVALALYLFTSEFLLSLDRRWETEMFIDDTRMEEKLQIDLNITLPCELLSYDAQDVMGSHEVDALGDLLKRRFTSKGDIIAKEEIHGNRHGQYWGLTRHFNFGYDNGDVDRIKNMVHSGEGCRPGYGWVNRVPGNIHLWTYSHAYLFSSLCQETQDINVSPCGSCVFWHGHCHHFGEGALCQHRDRVTSRRGAPGGRTEHDHNDNAQHAATLRQRWEEPWPGI